jgi:hypothetical protein
LLSAPAGISHAATPIPGLFNTGVDAGGVALTDNAIDPHYSLVAPSLVVGDAIVATSAGMFPIPPWLGDSPTSAWITPAADTNGPGNVDGSASYFYRTTFDLAGMNASGAVIVGRWASDNGGLDIRLNGTSTGFTNPAQFAAYTPFTLSASAGHPFIAGLNTLDFVVNNGAGEMNPFGPTGVRVEYPRALVLAPGESIVPIASLYSTGVDNSGVPLSPGTPDPHWNILASADGVFSAPGPAITQLNHPAWLANGPTSNWISVVPDGTTNIAAGTYIFETTFDLTGMDESTAIVTGDFASDNTVTDVLLNGVSAGIAGGGFTATTPFTFTSGFVPGMNSLIFVMENLPQPAPNPPENPGGFRVNLSGTAVVPEPSSVVLAVVGAAAFFVCRRRAK